MDQLERLKQEAGEENIRIIDNYPFHSNNIKGLYCNKTIALNRTLPTTAERACILSEELGHYHTTVGDILNQSDDENRKQEHRARVWSYNRLVGLDGIIKASEHGCASSAETAEFLGVTEEFLIDSIFYYRSKYGTRTAKGPYVIFFEPALSVLKLI